MKHEYNPDTGKAPGQEKEIGVLDAEDIKRRIRDQSIMSLILFTCGMAILSAVAGWKVALGAFFLFWSLNLYRDAETAKNLVKTGEAFRNTIERFF